MEKTCTWKIHLVDGSFRNIKVAASATAEEVVAALLSRIRAGSSISSYNSAFALRYIAVREAGWLLASDVLDTRLRDSLVGARLELRIRAWPKKYQDWLSKDRQLLEYAYEQLAADMRDRRFFEPVSKEKEKAAGVTDQQEVILYLSCLSLRIFTLKAQSNAFARFELNDGSPKDTTNANVKNKQRSTAGLNERFTLDGLDEDMLERFLGDASLEFARRTQKGRKALKRIAKQIDTLVASGAAPTRSCEAAIGALMCEFISLLAREARFDLERFSCYLYAGSGWTLLIRLYVSSSDEVGFVFESTSRSAQLFRFEQLHSILLGEEKPTGTGSGTNEQPGATWSVKLKRVDPEEQTTLLFSSQLDALNFSALVRAYAQLPDFGARLVPLSGLEPPEVASPPIPTTDSATAVNVAATSPDSRQKPPTPPVRSSSNAQLTNASPSSNDLLAMIKARSSAAQRPTPTVSTVRPVAVPPSQIVATTSPTAIVPVVASANSAATDSYTQAVNALASLNLPDSQPSVERTPTTTAKSGSVGGELDRNAIELLGLLGSGQYGEVYKGRLRCGPLDDGDAEAQLVAVKICKTDESPSERRTAVETCLQEAFIMRQFEHAHIVRLIGVCSMARPIWIVMEFAPFGELRSYLEARRGAVPLRSLLLFVHQVSQALSYLESRKFVHRDVAARNVLVSSVAPGRECVKLADFGLARWLADEEGGLYVASAGKLPIRWLAPESVNYRRFSAASDVWMFAVCAWEVFAFGCKPFAGVSNAQVVLSIERGDRLQRPEHCPPEVYALLRDCWSYEPEQRPIISAIVTRVGCFLTALDDESGIIRLPVSEPSSLPTSPSARNCSSLDMLNNTVDSSPCGSSIGVDAELPPKPKPPPLSFSVERLLQDAASRQDTASLSDIPQYRLSVVSADMVMAPRRNDPLPPRPRQAPSSSGNLVASLAAKPPLPITSPNRSNTSLDSFTSTRLRQTSLDAAAASPSRRHDSLASASSVYSRFDSFNSAPEERAPPEADAFLLPPPAAFADGSEPLSPSLALESLQDAKWLDDAERAFDPLVPVVRSDAPLPPPPPPPPAAQSIAVPGFEDDSLHTSTIRLVQNVYQFCKSLHETPIERYRDHVFQIGVDLRAMLAVADRGWSVLANITTPTPTQDRVPTQRQRVVRDLEALIGATKRAQQYAVGAASSGAGGGGAEQLYTDTKRSAHQLAIDAKQLYDELRDARDRYKRA